MASDESRAVILVTGGAGYLGSRLVRELAGSEGHRARIRILDNLQRSTHGALLRIPRGGPPVEFVEGDILDPLCVREALDDVDCVVHLAAIASTPFSFDHPVSTRQVNQWGTAHLVEHALEAGVTRFVFTSSTSVYGPGGPFDEETACRPMGPYSESKHAAEQAVLAAGERMDVTVLRLGVLFGQAPGARYDAVVNRLAFLAATGRPLTVFGDGLQKRPLVHVADASAAVRRCLDEPDVTRGKVLNVATGNWAVNDMVETIVRLRPFTRVVATDQDVRTHWSLEVVSDRMRQLGWQPRVQLAEGLGEVLEAIGPFAARPAPVLDPDL